MQIVSEVQERQSFHSKTEKNRAEEAELESVKGFMFFMVKNLKVSKRIFSFRV